MIQRNYLALIGLILLIAGCSETKTGTDNWIATAPAVARYTSIDRSGETVLPNGRIITPYGKTIEVAPHPFGLTLSPDGRTIVTANSGTGPFSISVITDYNGNPIVRQIPEGVQPDKGLLESVFMGLAISPDGQLIYVAGGQENKIHIFNLASGKKEGEINCSLMDGTNDFTDGYLGDMVLSSDGKKLFVVDQIGFRLIVADTQTRKVISNTPTGRYPFGIILTKDESRVHVVNVGMFEYSYIQSLDKSRIKETALRYPATAYGSKEMKEGIEQDTLKVKGLGDPNAPESFSVWTYDLTGSVPKVTSKIKTGVLVGEEIEGIPAVGGSSPNSLAVAGDLVFVSNGNNDNISVIDTKNENKVETIELKLDERLGNLRGVIPFGLTVSPDQKRLYVAEAGINAVAVIDISTRKVLGHIPTGWFPSKLKVTPDGKQLIVSNAKGFGSGPNGGKTFKVGPEGDYIGSLMKGTVSVMNLPPDDQLKNLTAKVISNNFTFTKAPATRPVWQDSIKYIVFISKENRTYDQVYGQDTRGKGDSSLAIYGRQVTFANSKGQLKLENVDVMPNHLALADAFTISDNFYVDSDVSADGHVWLTNTYPNQWMETHHPAAYGGQRGMREESKAPGKFGMTGAAGAIFPETYNQNGSMWEHLHRHGKEFFNFGFGVEFDAGSFSDSTFKYGGVRYLVNYPLPGPLYDRTSRLFPTFNMAIPDQFRTDIFIREMDSLYVKGKRPFPSMVTLQLLNDHGAGERPAAGFIYNESYMADNDLALGRVVEYLSHLPQWKNMLIVVTEDDAQGGNDHVDAHRSLLLVISPYARKAFNSHVHYSFGSLFKTFWNILDIPPLNQYDFGTTPLTDCLTDVPDFTPYNALPVDKRIFDPAFALTPFDEKFDWKAVEESVELDDAEEIRKAREKDKRMQVKH